MMASVGERRLKILFLSQRFLYPMDSGGKIRTGKILEHLKDIFDITLISNVESPKDDCYLHNMKGLCHQFYGVPWKEVLKYTPRFYMRILYRSFSRYPVTVINDYSKSLEESILVAIKKDRYDLLICDFLQPSLNFKKVYNYPKLLFQHNVESIIMRRHFEAAQDLLSKLFWWIQWIKMNRYERNACSEFAGVVTVSETDKSILEQEFGARNVFAIPTGVDTEYFAPSHEPVVENSLVFTGAMDWLPNEDAILFFAREILGKIRAQIPTITLTVVGRNPSRRLVAELQRDPAITIVGRVDDVRPFIGRHALYIIPLRIGGGTRIKAYEAMAMGKAVVSTRIGIEGLPVQHGEHVMMADTPAEFAAAVVHLLTHAAMRRQIETAARDYMCANFGWRQATLAFAEACVRVARG
jgi:glycosyltransferase involved in cell wall biosynthesis